MKGTKYLNKAVPIKSESGRMNYAIETLSLTKNLVISLMLMI